MIEVVPFHVKHLGEIKNRKAVFKNDPELDERIRLVASSPLCFCWTLMRSGQVVGILGGTQIWRGVLELWSLLSEDVLQTPLAFHRTVERILSFHDDNMNVHRYQAVVQSDFTQGQRWLEILGFQYEGLLRRYGVNGEDYNMFARVK